MPESITIVSPTGTATTRTVAPAALVNVTTDDVAGAHEMVTENTLIEPVLTVRAATKVSLKITVESPDIIFFQYSYVPSCE